MKINSIPRLCIAGTEHLWSVCRETRDKAGLLTEILAENMDIETARLFAAAPELLAALRELLADPYLSEPLNADRMRNARAAVAKAERGEE